MTDNAFSYIHNRSKAASAPRADLPPPTWRLPANRASGFSRKRGSTGRTEMHVAREKRSDTGGRTSRVIPSGGRLLPVGSLSAPPFRAPRPVLRQSLVSRSWTPTHGRSWLRGASLPAVAHRSNGLRDGPRTGSPVALALDVRAEGDGQCAACPAASVCGGGQAAQVRARCGERFSASWDRPL